MSADPARTKLASQEVPRLTDFERALCYYSIPRVTSPLSLALIGVYVVCVLEAVGALAYGLLTDQAIWTQAGVIGLAGIVVFGIAAFFVRAVLNRVQEQRVTALAEGVPDASDEDDSVPNPFADHVLLSYGWRDKGRDLEIVDEQGALRYYAHRHAGENRWVIAAADGSETFQAAYSDRPMSFSLGKGFPRELTILADGEPAARLAQRFSWTVPRMEAQPVDGRGKGFHVERKSIYCDGRLVGRFYYLHGRMYLDVEKDFLGNALLGLFVALE